MGQLCPKAKHIHARWLWLSRFKLVANPLASTKGFYLLLSELECDVGTTRARRVRACAPIQALLRL